MKETFRSLNWRKLIMVSTLLGVMFSVISISGSFIQTAFTQTGFEDPDGSRCCVTSELKPGCQPSGCQGSFFNKKCPTTPSPGSNEICGDISCKTCF
jgi:hypothetical protein